MYRVRTTVSIDQFFAYFRVKLYNYARVTRGPRSIAGRLPIPDNILHALSQANLTENAGHTDPYWAKN